MTWHGIPATVTRLAAVVVGLVTATTTMTMPAAVGAQSNPHYFVDGDLVVNRADATSYVRDATGTSNVAVIGPRTESVRYFQRLHGKTAWHEHHINGLSDYNGFKGNLRLGLSPDGRHVYLAVNCVAGDGPGMARGVYVLAKKASSANFPAATSSDRVFRGTCANQDNEDAIPHGTEYEIQGLVGLPHGRVGLLYYVTDYDNPRPKGPNPLYYASGVPGHHFTVHRLPGTRRFFGYEAALGTDATTGEVTVAAELVVNDKPGLYAMSKRPGHHWSAPDRLARANDGTHAGFFVVAVVAAKGTVHVGAQQYNFTGRDSPVPGDFLFNRDRAGHWSGRMSVPYTQKNDSLGAMAVTHAGGLHVLFDAIRHHGHTGGLRDVYRTASGQWNHPRTVTSNPNDGGTDVAAVPHGGFRYACWCQSTS